MSDKFLLSRIKSGLSQILCELSACALTNTSGEALFVKGNRFEDLGTLPVAAASAFKYFNLKHQQIIILNDPYSGGTTLNELTLVIGVSTTNTLSSDLMLAAKIPFRPSLKFNENYQPENFRIPPTPLLGFEGFDSDELLLAMSKAPESPEHFPEVIKQLISLLLEISNELRIFFRKVLDGGMKKAFFESYFSISNGLHNTWIDDLPFDKASSQLILDDGTTLVLNLQHITGRVLFDFAGSHLSSGYALTNASLLGLCTGALNSFFDIRHPVDNGHFRTITLHTPHRSRLNPTFPQSTELGHRILAPQILNLIYQALSKLLPKRAVAGHAMDVFLDFKFAGSHFFESLPGGTGASATKVGEDGLSLWNPIFLHPSFEEIEKRFPLKVLKQEKREGSCGRGQYIGGFGLRRSYEVQDNATMTWFFDPNKAYGMGGGSAGDAAKLILKTAQGQTTDLSAHGTLDLQPGDQVTILSGGGGGYGRGPQDKN